MRTRASSSKSKPLRLIHSSEEFHQLEPTSEVFPKYAKRIVMGQPKPVAKFLCPKFELVERITPPKPHARIGPNYIRRKEALKYPKYEYQLKYVDLKFIENHSKNYLCQKKVILTESFMQTAIQFLEKKAQRGTFKPKGKEWMEELLEEKNKQILYQPKMEELLGLIYHYWQQRRAEARFPLYRPLWKVSETSNCSKAIFQNRREGQKFLRKNASIPFRELVAELNSEFNTSIRICRRIAAQQQLKLRSYELQLREFYETVAQYVTPFEEFEQYCPENAATFEEEEEKSKSFRNDMVLHVQQEEILKTKRANEVNVAIASFIATVITDSVQLGIPFKDILPEAWVQQVAEEHNEEEGDDEYEEELEVQDYTAQLEMRQPENSEEYQDTESLEQHRYVRPSSQSQPNSSEKDSSSEDLRPDSAEQASSVEIQTSQLVRARPSESKSEDDLQEGEIRCTKRRKCF